MNLFVNLLLNKELSHRREEGAVECGGCGREYNKATLSYKDNNINWPATSPNNGVCGDVRVLLNI
jgi:hypothetical protein